MIKDHGQTQHLETSAAGFDTLAARTGRDVSLARRQIPIFALVFSPLAALLIWIAAVQGANPDAMNDLGLVSVLPLATFGALLLLFFSFSLALSQDELHVPILLLHVLVLIFALYGAAIMIEGVPRTGVAWRLVGIIEHVTTYGTVDLARDAFQNWPGFYILVAFLTSLAGIEPLILAGWAHMIFNLLYLGPLILLFRTATDDKRLIWLGVWFFYLNNWIGQDYLAPQAFGYLLYLVTLAILLNWFRGGTSVWASLKRRLRPGAVPVSDPEVGPSASPGRQLAGLTAIVIAFMVVLTPSHQLTPVALLASLAGLVLFGRILPRGLPIILGVLIAVWLSYMAVPFLRGHLNLVTEPLGALTTNIDQNLIARVRGSPDHVFIVLLRIYMTVFACLVAGAGAIRRLRHGQADLNFVLLILVPFPLLAFQTYGGELLLRTYLFALPFVSFFMAALFVPSLRAWISQRLALVIFLISAILGVAFFFTRYGNERMDYFRPGELEAIHYVYSVAEPGSQLIAGTPMLPWRFKEYNTYSYSVVNKLVHANDIQALIEQMDDPQFPRSYLILTRSQKASAELLFGWEPGTWERFEASLLASNRFTAIFANSDARVYVLASRQASRNTPVVAHALFQPVRAEQAMEKSFPIRAVFARDGG